MKKLLVVAAILLGGMFVLSSLATAEVFPVTVYIEPSSTANYVVWKLHDGADFPDDPETSTALTFSMNLETFGDESAFLADEYYAIDVSPTGAGQMNVLIQYADTGNPNNDPTKGLGARAIGTVVKSQTVDPFGELQLERATLLDLHNMQIFASDLENDEGGFSGFMRMYVGIASGDLTKLPPEPLEPFNPGDKSGNYTGTITLTATQQ